MNDGYNDTQYKRMPRGTTFADEVRGHYGLSVSRREGVAHAKNQ